MNLCVPSTTLARSGSLRRATSSPLPPAMWTGPWGSCSRPSRATSAGSADTHTRHVEVQPDALHGWRAGDTKHQFQYVDVVFAKLEPQTFGEDAPEGLHTPVDGVSHRAEVAGHRADHEDPATPALSHRPAEVLHQREHGGDIQVDHPLKSRSTRRRGMARCRCWRPRCRSAGRLRCPRWRPRSDQPRLRRPNRQRAFVLRHRERGTNPPSRPGDPAFER